MKVDGTKWIMFIIAGAFVAITLFPGQLLAKEPEEIWRELDKLSGEERQKRILAGASAEGKVVFYVNLSADHVEPLRLDFERRYPMIKFEFWRAPGEKTSNRVLTEARAQKFAADVIGPGNEHVPLLVGSKLIGRYNSPERRFYAEEHKDQEGYWTSVAYNLAIIAYNTKLVPPAEAPRRHDDFLRPKWKGNFAIDMEPDRALMVWLKSWGEEKTEKFLAGLIKNDAVVRKGHSLLTQLLCAGEFKVAIELYAYRVAEMKHKGCPIDLIYPDPTPGAVTPVVVARHSPHPYAAALLVDYLLSEPGQKILAERGWLSGRRAVKSKYPDLDLEAKGVKVSLLRPEDADRFGRKYEELRERFLLRR